MEETNNKKMKLHDNLTTVLSILFFAVGGFLIFENQLLFAGLCFAVGLIVRATFWNKYYRGKKNEQTTCEPSNPTPK
jgi:hypothetical protein